MVKGSWILVSFGEGFSKHDHTHFPSRARHVEGVHRPADGLDLNLLFKGNGMLSVVAFEEGHLAVLGLVQSLLFLVS